MKVLKNHGWAGLLLIIGAVSAALTSILEDITGTDQGLPEILFGLWFFCNTFGALGLSVFYSSKGSKLSGWINGIGLAALYILWGIEYPEWGFGLGFILFAAAAFFSKAIPNWVMVVELLAAAAAFADPLLPHTGFLSYFNTWYLGLGLAPLGTGLAVFMQASRSGEATAAA